jgi:hypothetical protein
VRVAGGRVKPPRRAKCPHLRWRTPNNHIRLPISRILRTECAAEITVRISPLIRSDLAVLAGRRPSRFNVMNDIEQIVRRLRQFASELVRSGRPSDAAAVLAGIGALEILELFSTSGQPHTGGGEQYGGGEQHGG